MLYPEQRSPKRETGRAVTALLIPQTRETSIWGRPREEKRGWQQAKHLYVFSPRQISSTKNSPEISSTRNECLFFLIVLMNHSAEA